MGALLPINRYRLFCTATLTGGLLVAGCTATWHTPIRLSTSTEYISAIEAVQVVCNVCDAIEEGNSGGLLQGLNWDERTNKLFPCKHCLRSEPENPASSGVEGKLGEGARWH
jgi:hypothetical protein